MTWKLLVVRKDSPIRMYNVTRQQSVRDLARPGSSVFDGVSFDRFLIDSDGGFHVDLDQLQSLMRALIQSSQEDRDYFEIIADRYENMGREWMAWTHESCAVTGAESDDCLAQIFAEFSRRYVAYTPVLFVPFAVELRYRVEYPAALERLSRTTGVEIPALKHIVEASARRTMAEEKAEALRRLHGVLQKQSLLNVDVNGLRQHAPAVFDELVQLAAQFAWIAHWGYPPYYSDATLDDLLAEARHQRVHSDDGLSLLSKRASLFAEAKMSDEDRALFNDVARWVHLRTWRMEVKIRCQRLSVPLLRELERRALDRGQLGAEDDIFFLTPPEIQALAEGGVPAADITARRAGWYLLREGGDTLMRDGTDFERTRDVFLSVIDDRADGRGVRPIDRELVGGKAMRLFELRARGFTVPRFFVVSTYAFIRYAADKDRAREALERMVASHLGALNSGILMVRSSSNLEDDAGASWAGRFQSVAYVPTQDLWNAIEHVWQSATSDAAREYAERRGLAFDGARMAVIVQEMIDPEWAGVADLSSANGGDGIIEIVAGHGEALVTGGESPTTYIVRGGKVTERQERKQARSLRSGAWQDNVNQTKQLDEVLLAKVLDMVRNVVEFYREPQNVEFCIADNTVYLLQARPNTSFAEGLATDAVERDSRAVIARGLPGTVHRQVSGQARVLTRPAERGVIDDGSILVIHAATPAWDSAIMRAAALVTNEGGATSHAVRVCNELGIAVVAGTGNATSVMSDQQPIIVDTRDSFAGYVLRAGVSR